MRKLRFAGFGTDFNVPTSFLRLTGRGEVFYFKTTSDAEALERFADCVYRDQLEHVAAKAGVNDVGNYSNEELEAAIAAAKKVAVRSVDFTEEVV